MSDPLNVPRFVSSIGIRIATCVFGLVGMVATGLYAGGSTSEVGGITLSLSLASGVLTLIGMIHSFRGTYLLWMRFTSILHVVVTTASFAFCYLVVVPVFFLIVWALDPLHLRTHGTASTYWIHRRRAEVSAGSLQRMG